jgi:hypoxanthine phosphoribosyltransferase
MRIYTKDDTNPMSWEEYGATVKTLLDEVCASGVAFDAIAPILRSGGIPGNVLAIRLQITRIIPLQFKYLSHPPRLEQTNLMPRQPVTDPVNILICENNTSTGGTAQAAIAQLRKMFPYSKLHYATVAKVFGGPDAFAGAEGYYFGVQTNERFLATPVQMKEFSLRPGMTLFPWEIAEHELKEINSFSSSHS